MACCVLWSGWCVFGALMRNLPKPSPHSQMASAVPSPQMEVFYLLGELLLSSVVKLLSSSGVFLLLFFFFTSSYQLNNQFYCSVWNNHNMQLDRSYKLLLLLLFCTIKKVFLHLIHWSGSLCCLSLQALSRSSKKLCMSAFLFYQNEECLNTKLKSLHL